MEPSQALLPGWAGSVLAPHYSNKKRYGLAVAEYVERRMMGAAALDLLLATFEYIIASCKARNAEKVEKGLLLLESSLDFQAAPTVAGLFLAAYRQIENLVGEARFEECLPLLVGLAEAWEKVKAGAQKPIS
jgi:hypothetical protein